MAPPTTKKRIPAASNETTGVVTKRGDKTGVIKEGDVKEAKQRLVNSTQRALVLRNGKAGIMGTGEVVLGKMSGREKLEILAEDSMQQSEKKRKELLSSNAVRAPFDLDSLIRWSQSQMDAALDQVNNLHETDFCYEIVERHISSQIAEDQKQHPFSDRTRVASEFGICVHNSYMIASAWTLLHELLVEMKRLGLQDKMVLKQMRSSAEIRTLYMLTYNMAKNLVAVGQQRLRSIVQNTAHFAPYFSEALDSKDGSFHFNNAVLRNMYKSYLDSAIIELCLPGSQFSPAALFQCLHDVEEESPKRLKDCPQAMWDAVGDLAEAVKIQDQMETPLLVPEGRAWQEEMAATEEPMEMYSWIEAQNSSLEACQMLTKLEGQLSPITNLKDKNVLKKIWIELNSNCKKVSDMDLDHLWQLDFVRANRKPQWTYRWIDLNPSAPDPDSEDDDKRPVPGSKPGKKKRLAITNGEDGYESNSSMPGLLDVSNSEEEDEDEESAGLSTDDEDDEDSSDEDEDEDSDGYDEDEEEEIRHMFREAMNAYNENPDIIDEADKYAEERKKNPFLKLLGALKGRMFQKSSALRTDGKTTQTATSGPKKSQAKASAPPKKTAGPDDMPPLEPLTRHLNQTHLDDKAKKTTVEDADDESDEPKADKKKKKKKKPKKKKNPTAEGTATATETQRPETPVEPPKSPIPPQVQAVPGKPASPPPSPAKKKATPSVKSGLSGSTQRSSGLSSSTATAAFGSSISLSLPTEEKAESARSYLASIGVKEKTKVKTRPDQPLEPVQEKRSLFTKLGFRGKDKEAKTEQPKQEHQKPNVFGGLKKKSKLCAQKLFGISVEDRKGSLKWDHFVQLMRDLGFDYDPSTAGSSVRFDPPNPGDRSISFHKPHPDPTLHQNHLKEFRTKLMEYYAWSPEQLKMMDRQFGPSEVD